MDEVGVGRCQLPKIFLLYGHDIDWHSFITDRKDTRERSKQKWISLKERRTVVRHWIFLFCAPGFLCSFYERDGWLEWLRNEARCPVGKVFAAETPVEWQDSVRCSHQEALLDSNRACVGKKNTKITYAYAHAYCMIHYKYIFMHILCVHKIKYKCPYIHSHVPHGNISVHSKPHIQQWWQTMTSPSYTVVLVGVGTLWHLRNDKVVSNVFLRKHHHH